MAHSDPSENEQVSRLEHMSEDVFSFERREDIWAIIIAGAILILSAAIPDQIHHFFTRTLYLF